jgi:glycogen synthase
MGAKLLILSYTFAPSVGGTESVGQVLAEDLSKRGYCVTVVTQISAAVPEDNASFHVVRCPNHAVLLKWLFWADVVLQNNTSLRLAWPLYLLFPRKPFLLVHHTPIAHPSGAVTWRHRLKRMLLWRPYSLSVSQYMADTVGAPSKVVMNPFADDIFSPIGKVEQPTNDLLFVGRLVPAKGVDILIRALALLAEKGIKPQLSVIGSGTEEHNLSQLAEALGVARQVTFFGPRKGKDLALVMNQHKILVVPSRPKPPEALGIVAIEGIACGCVVVGSRNGGLPEAIGPCGLLFENEDVLGLANCLSRLLFDEALRMEFRAAASAHVARFKRSAIVDDYERHINVVMNVPSGGDLQSGKQPQVSR